TILPPALSICRLTGVLVLLPGLLPPCSQRRLRWSTLMAFHDDASLPCESFGETREGSRTHTQRRGPTAAQVTRSWRRSHRTAGWTELATLAASSVSHLRVEGPSFQVRS